MYTPDVGDGDTVGGSVVVVVGVGGRVVVEGTGQVMTKRKKYM